MNTNQLISKINENVLFDCTKLESELYNKDIQFDSNDIVPKIIDENTIELCKIKFNLKSLIYEKSTSNEIVVSWDHFKKFFDAETIIQIFMFEYILKLNRLLKQHGSFEIPPPDLMDLISLVYWHYKCSKFKNFSEKRKEIQDKMGKGLLKKFNRYKTTIPNNIKNSKLWIDIKKQYSEEEKKKFHNYMKNWFKECSGFNAELMSAYLSSEAGFTISYENYKTKNNKNNQHDFDFLLNNIPVQVKTFIIYRRSSEICNNLSQNGLKKETEHLQIKYNFDTLYKNNELNWDNLYPEIINSIKSNRNTIIKGVNKQKAKLIIYDATQSASGYGLGLYNMINKPASFIECIKKSIEILSSTNNYVPLLFIVSAIYITHQLSCLCFKIPYVRGQVIIDESSIDQISFEKN